ncbi:MAG: hypothetical protein ACTSPQ_12245 [Candidatus Helarchaeota archaeon]
MKAEDSNFDYPDKIKLYMKKIALKEGYYKISENKSEKLRKIWKESYSIILKLFIKIFFERVIRP